MKALVTELISQGLGLTPCGQLEKPLASPMVEVGQGGLPMIRCDPKAPATRMSAEDLLKLEQEAQLEEDRHHAGLSD